MTDQAPRFPMDALKIRELLPHRFPFLLIDRVLQMDDAAQWVHAIKCVSQNEPFFPGHFPAFPVMPGVLQIEALAQTGAIFMLLRPESRGKTAFLTGVEGFKFRRPVVPGDVLELHVQMQRLRGAFGKAHARATVDNEVTAEGQIGFMIGDE